MRDRSGDGTTELERNAEPVNSLRHFESCLDAGQAAGGDPHHALLCPPSSLDDEAVSSCNTSTGQPEEPALAILRRTVHSSMHVTSKQTHLFLQRCFTEPSSDFFSLKYEVKTTLVLL
jgi:hypothetical protein